MSIVKDQYDIKEKNTAMFVACLKNSSVYEDHGKIVLVDNENLNDLINKLISEKKFIDANELINTAKNVRNENLITAEVTSKSFRLPIETYTKLMILSGKNDEPLGEILTKIIINKMCSTINELHNISNVEKEKLEILTGLIENWNKKKLTKRYFYPFIDLPHFIYEIDENFIKYIKKIFETACLKFDLDPNIANMFIDLHTMDYPNFIKFLSCNFATKDNKIMYKLNIEFSYGIDDEAGDITNGIFYNNSKETFGEHSTDVFLDKISDGLCGGVAEAFLGIYEIYHDNGNVYINGVDSQDEKLLQMMVYNKLANEYPTYHYHDDLFEISYDISLLPSDFDEDNYSQRLQEAIANNDYESSSKISEILETHQILTMLSIQVCDILNKILKETKVVSITIPKTLLNLFDLTRGAKSAKNFIREEVDNYWKNHKTEE